MEVQPSKQKWGKGERQGSKKCKYKSLLLSLRLSWLNFSGTSGRHAECVPTQSTWRRGTDSSYFPIVWGLSSRATYTPPLKTPYFSVMLTSGHSSEKTQRIKAERCISCAWSLSTILREVTRNHSIQMQLQSSQVAEGCNKGD